MADKLFIAVMSVLFTFLIFNLGLLFYTIATDVITTYGLSGAVAIALAVTIFSMTYRKIKQECDRWWSMDYVLRRGI